MPMKPIRPAEATLAPTASATSRIASALMRWTGMPRWYASASHQPIEAAGQQRHREQQRQDDRRHRRKLRPAGAAEAAERPEGQVAQLPVVRQIGEEARQGSGQRSQRHAGEQHGGDRGPALPGGDEIEHQRRDQAAAEGAEGQGGERKLHQRAGQEAVAEDDGRGRGEPRPGRDAHEAGIGQRISEETLHQGAGDREAGTDQQAEQHARQPDVEDDECVPALEHGGVAGEPRPKDRRDPPGRDGDGALADGHDREKQAGDGQARQRDKADAPASGDETGERRCGHGGHAGGQRHGALAGSAGIAACG